MVSSTSRHLPPVRYATVLLAIRAVAIALIGLGVPGIIVAGYWTCGWATRNPAFDSRWAGAAGRAGIPYQIAYQQSTWRGIWNWLQSTDSIEVIAFMAGVLVLCQATVVRRWARRRARQNGGADE